MEIKQLSKGCVMLKGKKESVLINPDGQNAKSDSRILIFNSPEFKELRRADDKVAIMGPGEYEVGGVEVTGVADGDNNTMYTVLVDGVMVGCLGKLSGELSEKKTEKIAAVDVLLADIANKGGIGYKNLLALAKTWGANYIVPVGYTDNDADLTAFLNETDNEGLEKVESLKIDKDNLPEGLEVVALKY